jgi:hypothetical protein
MDGFFRNTGELGMSNAAGQMPDTMPLEKAPRNLSNSLRTDNVIGKGPPEAKPLDGLELQTVQLHDMIKNLHRAIDDLSKLLAPLVAQRPMVPEKEMDESMHPSNSSLGNALLEASKEIRDAKRRIVDIRLSLDL